MSTLKQNPILREQVAAYQKKYAARHDFRRPKKPLQIAQSLLSQRNMKSGLVQQANGSIPQMQTMLNDIVAHILFQQNQASLEAQNNLQAGNNKAFMEQSVENELYDNELNYEENEQEALRQTQEAPNNSATEQLATGIAVSIAAELVLRPRPDLSAGKSIEEELKAGLDVTKKMPAEEKNSELSKLFDKLLTLTPDATTSSEKKEPNAEERSALIDSMMIPRPPGPKE